MNDSLNNKQPLVVVSQGGKGGGGKTTIMNGLADYYQSLQVPVSYLDGDIENQRGAGFASYHHGTPKIDIRSKAGLDEIVNAAMSGQARVVMLDLGGGSGRDVTQWFDEMYEVVGACGVRFTLLGSVLESSSSVESLIAWGKALRDRVRYVVVLNHRDGSEFSFWNTSEPAQRFRDLAKPTVIEYPRCVYQKLLENSTLTLGSYLAEHDFTKFSGELGQWKARLRAQAELSAVLAQFEKARDYLLP